MGAREYEGVRERADLRQFAADNLKPAGDGYECPACGSGSGPNRSPAFKIMPDGKRWHCFSCEREGDIFDLYGILNDTEDSSEQLEGVARWAGVEPKGLHGARKDRERAANGATGTQAAKGGNKGKSAGKPGRKRPLYWDEKRAAKDRAADMEEGRARSSAYVDKCAANVEHPASLAYLNSINCPLDVAKRHRLGYDAATGREVFPYPNAGWYYTARDVTGIAIHKYELPSTAEVGKGPIWDVDALDGPVAFVVEGQKDAIAVAECGGRAICTNGTKDLKRAAKEAAKHPRCFLYLLFDSDERGGGECDSFLLELERLGAYSFGSVEVVRCPYPDPWDWYAADAEGMRAEIARLIESVPTDDERIKAFADTLAPEGGDVAEWLDGSEPLPTGIDTLDAALGGGLYGGLHVLAAAPGAGKSSLAIQIAINAAIGGAGVLYVSLEMTRADVIARCAAYVSRTFYQNDRERAPFTFAEFERMGAKLARDARGDEARAREIAEFDPKVASMLSILDVMPTTFLYRLAIADGCDGSLSDVEGVVSLMERAARAGCSLVVVDYLQYIDAGRAAATYDKSERDGYVAKKLTDAAKRLNLRVLALSSITKSEGGKDVKDADPFSAKGSSDIGHDAVTVIRLEHVPSTLPNMQAGNSKLRLKLAKNRKGESGKIVSLDFWAGYATVRSLSDDEE